MTHDPSPRRRTVTPIPLDTERWHPATRRGYRTHAEVAALLHVPDRAFATFCNGDRDDWDDGDSWDDRPRIAHRVAA